MRAERTNHDTSAAELAALLILCRLARFFCCDTPYSVGYAKNMFLAGVLQAVLLLPMFFWRKPFSPPVPLRFAAQGLAIWLAADMAADCYRLLVAADAPNPPLTMILLILCVFYAANLPRTAVYRAGLFLLCAAVCAFLLLPIGGLSSARFLSLWSNSTQNRAFLLEWKESAELALLPFLACKNPKPAKKAAAAWITVRCTILPAVVLFGAMQCGRLRGFRGNPFMLLLARVPFSDTLRTDGLWLMLAVGCAALGTAFLTQVFLGSKPRVSKRFLFFGTGLLSVLTILFIMHGSDDGLSAAVSAVLTLLQRRCSGRETIRNDFSR